MGRYQTQQASTFRKERRTLDRASLNGKPTLGSMAEGAAVEVSSKTANGS
jgi:hypothetical protein